MPVGSKLQSPSLPCDYIYSRPLKDSPSGDFFPLVLKGFYQGSAAAAAAAGV